MLVEGGPIRGEEDMTMADRFAKNEIVKHCDILLLFSNGRSITKTGE
jgi:hypothetical protein